MQDNLVFDVLENVKKVTLGFYQSVEGKTFLSATNRNQLSFIWEARYKDGTVIRQFDDVAFFRALTDADFIPPVNDILSTDKIDKTKAVRYELHPIAYTRAHCPWFQRPFSVVLKPEKGERLLAYWCTDFQPSTGYELKRHVFGIAKVNEEENETSRAIFIVSPSGSLLMSTDDNASIEGE